MNARTWTLAACFAIFFSCSTYAGPHEEAIKEAQQLMDQYTELYDQGKYKEALPVIKKSLEIREKELGTRHRGTADTLYKLGVLYFTSGDYSLAERVAQRSLVIREKILGAGNSDTANSINLLGNIAWATGHFAKAELLHLRALAIREKVFGPDSSEAAVSLINLASLYGDMGEYAKAESLSRRALTINEQVVGPEHPKTATLLNNIGVQYMDTGLYDEAETLIRRALVIRENALGPEHPDVAGPLNNLAEIYVQRGDFSTAESLLLRAETIFNKSFGAQHPRTATAMGNLSELYFRMHAYDKAEPLLKNVIAMQEKSLGPDHPDLAQSLDNLANIYSATGSFDNAISTYERALSIDQNSLGAWHPNVANTLNGLSICNWRMGNLVKASELFARAQSIQAKNLERFLFIGSDADRRNYLSFLASDLYTLVSFSIAAPNDSTALLGLTAVLQHKGRMLDSTSSNVARLRRSVIPADQAIFEQLTDVTNQLSILTYRNAGDLSPEEYQKQSDHLMQQQASLEAKLAERSAEFKRQVTPITIDSVRRAMPRDSVLIEWLRYQPFDPNATAQAQKPAPRYVAYILKRSGEISVVDVGDAVHSDELALKFREALSDPTHGDVKERAIALSDQVIKPLRSHIEGVHHLLMSPDGALNLVPMDALVDESGHYLAEHTEITYLTSGRDLLRFATNANPHTSVVVANPDFGQPLQLIAKNDSIEPKRSAELDRSGFIFRPLASTTLEAQSLKALLKLDDAHVLTGASATEANIKQLHGPRVLHIASHGFFLEDQEFTLLRGSQENIPQLENPLLRSGIALAGANERHSGPNDDGILTALEAAQLDLHGTELVVLSACDSGVGQVQNGEGVYGLRRALILAGAQTEVMSLWKVSDDATSKLMIDYYQRLLKGESRAAALHHAQQVLLTSSDHSHPYYWAAFVSIGNPAPLSLAH